mgnify:CR=1 FL=1
MTSFSNFLKKIFASNNGKEETEIEQIVRCLTSYLPPVECIRLRPQAAENLSLFDSKLGGVPYLPKDAEYPMGKGKYAGKPLRLLAQLNLDTLPPIADLPTQGMLQFFCSSDQEDGMYGLDFDEGSAIKQDGFRVIYYSNIITDEKQLTPANEMPQIEGEETFPLTENYLLKAEKRIETASVSDYRFEPSIIKAIKDATGKEITSLSDLDAEHKDIIRKAFYFGKGTKIGGYPFFTQDDPRYNEAYSNHTFCLLQIDSEATGIMWGDMGVGNFFIEPERLKKLDFSNVMYNWDCY